MLDFSKVPAEELALVDRVCSALVGNDGLHAERLMIVGAQCRDIIQAALGHDFALRTTTDVDCAITVDDWKVYDELTASMSRLGGTGICFDVVGIPTDIMPFGAVERPTGTVTPPTRGEDMSVWGFREVFAASHALHLPGAGSVRIPSIPGYCALKLAAWLDRSAYGAYKDASDIAIAIHWYIESPTVEDHLYDDTTLLALSGYDPRLGASRLLGADIASLIGPQRVTELRERWPGEHPYALVPEMKIAGPAPWPDDHTTRLEILNAFEAGLGVSLTIM
ncbi:hypothetical protein [Nocardioides zeae]|uniref:Nucleotidyltransferase n=1 Tax=Nocardioides zeae TaxID=1457234 RepID=A0A6P0HKQ7_9ACTN|nr:hypothetical protein [Nocardioides zeae]NEN78215.1 hypothetical protein [Nocardioides zeae]